MNFLGDSSSLVRYSDSQTETQDSSLTQIYDHSSTYFNDQHQDLKDFQDPPSTNPISDTTCWRFKPRSHTPGEFIEHLRTILKAQTTSNAN
ncbi:hypothetical protein F8388_001720 [Cannabis sativa]|uniref:Uncharacterized protein n=1 Tax=Cannabis sativa TaxID=3483 RepID=A0A7J6EJG7_CANSA|nr:hypothetical protein G4B88_012840 [Cannabis sativa]KAF4395333.1 hypothetical protein F8388_001720 [Cannabis sativa]